MKFEEEVCSKCRRSVDCSICEDIKNGKIEVTRCDYIERIENCLWCGAPGWKVYNLKYLSDCDELFKQYGHPENYVLCKNCATVVPGNDGKLKYLLSVARKEGMNMIACGDGRPGTKFKV